MPRLLQLVREAVDSRFENAIGSLADAYVEKVSMMRSPLNSLNPTSASKTPRTAQQQVVSSPTIQSNTVVYITISGATGKYSDVLNGTYWRTREVVQGFPTFCKSSREDGLVDEIWIEYFENAWHVKKSNHRGKRKCYASSARVSIPSPELCAAGTWMVRKRWGHLIASTEDYANDFTIVAWALESVPRLAIQPQHRAEFAQDDDMLGEKNVKIHCVLFFYRSF